jgi:hypothetical protein
MIPKELLNECGGGEIENGKAVPPLYVESMSSPWERILARDIPSYAPRRL